MNLSMFRFRPAVQSFSLVLLSAFFATSLSAGDPANGKGNEKATPAKAKDAPATKSARKPQPAYAPVEDVAGLPRVLLIGDSISIGYTLAVRAQLAGKANVHRPATNCGPTIRGLESIDQWLSTGGAEKKWDVIHFNWGLHDLKYMDAAGKMPTKLDPADPQFHHQVSPDDYRKNLETLVARLQKTGAKLIWCSTTPVPEGSAGRVVGDVLVYNQIASEVMRKAGGIEVDDLYSFALPKLAEIQLPANVHYTPEGYSVLAQQVSRSILEALGR